MLKGPKEGKRRSGDGIIKREMRQVIESRFTDQIPLFPEEETTASDVVAEARADYEKLHDLPSTDPDAREQYYREHVENSEPIQRLKRAMDEWCAVWFWPLDEESAKHVPTPLTFHDENSERIEIATQVVSQLKFFHWELEFPDVFTPDRSGFDATTGNPPWDVMKPNSQEFFSDIDPLYRTYGKQQANARQKVIFQQQPTIEQRWWQYNALFKSLSNWAKHISSPFDILLKNGKAGKRLLASWASHRTSHKGFADLYHPFRYQGSADLNSYKLFTELSWYIAGPTARVGIIVPSGLYSDSGSKALRELYFDHSSLDLLYAFQNEKRVFAAAHHSVKPAAVFLTKGGTTAKFLAHFRLGVGDSPKAHELPSDLLNHPEAQMDLTLDEVRTASPDSLSLVELRTPTDKRVFQQMNKVSYRVSEGSNPWALDYGTEFHTTGDSRLFSPTHEVVRKNGAIPDCFGRFLAAGDDLWVPVYQGSLINQMNANAAFWVRGMGHGAIWEDVPPGSDRVYPNYVMRSETFQAENKSKHHWKLAYRGIARATDSRSMIACLISNAPTLHSLNLLMNPELGLGEYLTLLALLNSLCYDFALRQRLVGTNLSKYIIYETPLPRRMVRCGISQLAIQSARYSLLHRRNAADWLFLRERHTELQKKEWKKWWAVTEADRVRMRVEMDALAADLYRLEPSDFDWMLRDDPRDPKGFYRVERKLPYRERVIGLASAAFRALKEGKWSAETAANLSNDEFFDILGIPELTNPAAAKAKGLPDPLILKRDGCHVWRPETFPEDDPRHGWTWDDCWNDAVALLGSEDAVREYIEPKPETEPDDSEEELFRLKSEPASSRQKRLF